MPRGCYHVIECPICGQKVGHGIRRHVKSHNISIEEYVLKLFGLNEIPKCSCGKPRAISLIHNGHIHDTCGSVICRNRLVNLRSIRSGNNIFSHQKSELMKKIRVDNGLRTQRHRKELGLPSFLNITPEAIERSKITRHKTKVKNDSFTYWYKINVILNGHKYKFRSSWEVITILWLTYVRHYDKSDLSYEKVVKGVYPDFYIKSKNKYIEVHPANTMQDKKNAYNKLGIKIIYFDEVNVWRMNSDLHKSKFDIDKLFLFNIYRDDFVLNLDSGKFGYSTTIP